MQTTATHFKQLVIIANAALLQHNNLHCNFFSNTRNTIKQYALANNMYATTLTKKQCDTVLYCIAFDAQAVN